MPPPQKRVYRMDKIQKADDRIKSNKWDIEAWSVLLRDAQGKRIEDSRDIFERIVSQFPLSGQYWKIYIQHEVINKFYFQMKAQNFERVEKLFQRCLVKILNIDLWKLYLSYIRETKAKHPNFKEKMAQAYDFTLDRMGLDLNFYSVWNDYILFLRSAQVSGSYAESQKITATRRVYQRAIVTPMLGIETIWRDYCMYENNINPAIAKKFTEDRTKEYTNARRVAKEYEAITKGLSRNMPSVPPQNTPYEVKQVELWKKYIQWEKDNPLKTEDVIVITKRVIFAYEQCLLCLGHHPDIWYEAATYLEHASKQLADKGDQIMARQFADETAAIYERAIDLLKSNMMLYFAYADYEEGRGKYNKVHTIYKKILSLKDIDPTLPYIQYMKSTRRCEGIMSARLVFKKARSDTRVKYHVYVAAASMEYFCSKSKTTAHKIFELGMKRFGSVSEFVLCYMDFMTYLNEDNNTRVLFERALGSSSQLPPERTWLIWARFLQFESQVGDLASILKVEKRRLAILENVKEFLGRETGLIIDRYRFLDLFPCSESELRSLGYRELSRMQITSGIPRGSFLSFGNITEDGGIPYLNSGNAPASDVLGLYSDQNMKKPTYPLPDINQMLPFKPKAYPRTGSHIVPGGEFPPPPSASNLLRIMPPPENFQGPFVQVDRFMEHFLDLEIPEDYISKIVEQSEDLADNIDAGTALSIELASAGGLANPLLLGNRKRKHHINLLDGKQKNARALNAFGDSEDEQEDSDFESDNDVDEDQCDETTNMLRSMRHEAMLMKQPAHSGVYPGFVDLFRMRQSKKNIKH